jgi:hypothetical protein
MKLEELNAIRQRAEAIRPGTFLTSAQFDARSLIWEVDRLRALCLKALGAVDAPDCECAECAALREALHG